MTIPNQTFTIRDPGLGVVGGQGENAFVFYGCSSTGTVNTVLGFGSTASIKDYFGQGPLPEAMIHALIVAGGGVVYGCRLTGSTAGAAGSVTKTAVGSSTGTVTVAGAAYDRYEVAIEIMTTGTLAAGEFRYSLDGERTFSETLTIPSGGTYAIDGTNLTLTFVPGAGAVYFQDGDFHRFTTTAPHYSTTEIALGITALTTYLTTTPELELNGIVLVGRNATGSGAATIFGAMATHAATLAARYQFVGWIQDAGSADTESNVKTAFASVADQRGNIVYGDIDLPSGKPFAGFGAPKTSALVSVAARALASLISTDLARVASGPLKSVLELSRDEFSTPNLDAAKITSLRTVPLATGFFVTNGLMKSPSGSDFKHWQHRRVMDKACSVVARTQVNWLSMGVEVNEDGTIEESEAKRLEAIANEALKVALIDPKNAEGRPGHVSDFKYTINRTNNVLLSETVASTVAIRPLGYAKTLTTELGFSAKVSG